MELLAALAGTYYINKRSTEKVTKYFVAFLWLTFAVELIGAYPAIAYFSEYKYFSFVKDTPFRANYWLYNCFFLVSYSFYVYYFRSFIKNPMSRLFLKTLIILYVLSGIVNLFVTDVFFRAFSQYLGIVGSLMLLLSIILFFFELLKSDAILKLKKFLPFYISIGVFVFTLCITPLNIFMQHFNIPTGDDLFVNLRANVYLYTNIFMYSTFILGFIICSTKKTYY